MTPRDFCIWLQGYLANPGATEYKVDFRMPIEEKLKEVDLTVPFSIPGHYSIVSHFDQHNKGPTA